MENINNSHITTVQPEKWILKSDGRPSETKAKKGRFVNLYLSVYYYLREHHSDYNHFDLITEIKDVTYERLMSNDINFFNFYDPVAVGSYNLKLAAKYEELLISLPDDKVYPPKSYFKIQHDKCEYYSFLKKEKFSIVPFTCVDKTNWNKAINKTKYVSNIYNITRQYDSTFFKPVMGTSGRHTMIFPLKKRNSPNYTKQRLLKKLNDVFKEKFPKVVLQKYISDFAKKGNVEIKMYFVGKKYQYSIVSVAAGKSFNMVGESHGMAALDFEGGEYKQLSKAVVEKLKKIGLNVIKILQNKLHEGLSTLVTRVDFGCCYPKGEYFINEIEYAPAFLNGWFKRPDKIKIDVEIAKQMMKIVEELKIKKMNKYPMMIHMNKKAPSLDMFSNMKSIKCSNKSTTIKPINATYYVLGCYKALCEKNQNLHQRLKLLNFYMHEAGVNMENIKLLPIFWKDDFSKAKLKNLALYRNSHFPEQMKLGEIGNMLSHLSAFLKFLQTKDEYCIILEDDAHLQYNANENIKLTISKLYNDKKPWDIIWLYNSGTDEYNTSWNKAWHMKPTKIKFNSKESIKISKNVELYKMEKNFIGSTTGYVINRRAAMYMLNRAFPIGTKQTDVFMQSNIKNYIH